MPISSLSIAGREYMPEHFLDAARIHGQFKDILGEMILDIELEKVQLSSDEVTGALQSFQGQFSNESELADYVQSRGISIQEQYELVLRAYRLEKYKQARWGCRVNTAFLDQKAGMDKVIYCLIRVAEPDLANELYYRIRDDGESMAVLANQYSETSAVDGVVGPISLRSLHPDLAQILSTSQVGQLHGPMQVRDWSVILRLDAKEPAVLDEEMRHRLMTQLQNEWMEETLSSAMRSLISAPGSETQHAS